MRTDASKYWRDLTVGVLFTWAILGGAGSFLRAAEVQSFGAVVPGAASASSANYHSHTVAVAVGTSAGSTNYATRSGGATTFNNAPTLASNVFAFTGRPDAVQVVNADDLIGQSGATDVDGDPLSVRLSALAGIFFRNRPFTNQAEIGPGEHAVWSPPIPVGHINELVAGRISDGAAESAGELSFHGEFEPIISIHSALTVTAGQGSSATIGMGTDGTHPLTHQWYRDGTPLSGATAADLFLNPVGRPESGFYSLVVSNAFGHAVSSNVYLKVLVPQEIGQPTPLLSGGIRFAFGDFDGGALTADNLNDFRVQWSTNLNAWTDLSADHLSLSSGVVVVEDGDAVGPRFYRVLSQ